MKRILLFSVSLLTFLFAGCKKEETVNVTDIDIDLPRLVVTNSVSGVTMSSADVTGCINTSEYNLPPCQIRRSVCS